MKLTRAPKRFALNVGIQFREKLTNGLVVDIWSEKGRSPGQTLSGKLPKEFLKQDMGLRNRIDVLY